MYFHKIFAIVSDNNDQPIVVDGQKQYMQVRINTEEISSIEETGEESCIVIMRNGDTYNVEENIDQLVKLINPAINPAYSPTAATHNNNNNGNGGRHIPPRRYKNRHAVVMRKRSEEQSE